MSPAEPTMSTGQMALLGAGVGLAAGYAYTQQKRRAGAADSAHLEAGAPARAAPRVPDPQMGASILELRSRIATTKNTRKITSAMKLVAAAKVRRAQEAVLRSRPFSETLERILGGLLQRVKTEGLDIPLLEDRPVKKA